MKKPGLLIAFSFGAVMCAVASGSAQGRETLGTALTNTAAYISQTLAQGMRVVVLNFNAPAPDLANYAADELSARLVNSRLFTVIDRANLETIQAELKFQLSGDVSDETAQSIGRMTGAQTIITGSISPIGSVYRMSVKMTGIEKGEIQGQRVCELRNDRLLSGLVKGHEERTTQQPSTVVYKIGGRGPAGGWIFYDKGIYSNGWRYLEAAPAETEFNAEWGPFGRNVNGTITVIGTGKRNTQVIVEYLQQTGERGRAAQLCDSLVMDGYDDWFLPGKDELNLMYQNLKRKELGDFSDSWYWSSSESDNYYAWVQSFSNGSQGGSFKSVTYSVRAVRAF